MQGALDRCDQGIVFISDGLKRHLAEGFHRLTVLVISGLRRAQNQLASRCGGAGLSGVNKSDQAVTSQNRGDRQVRKNGVDHPNIGLRRFPRILALSH